MTFPTNRYGRLAFKLGVVGVALTSAAVPAAANPTTRPGGPAFGPAVLTRFAALPAQTYLSASDPSGSLLGTAAINGITPPFADQPIQGFSGIVRNSDGTFDVLSDNGYGTGPTAPTSCCASTASPPTSPTTRSMSSAGSTSPTRTATCRTR